MCRCCIALRFGVAVCSCCIALRFSVAVLRCAVVALLHDYYYCKCLVASDSRDRIPDLETVLKAVAIRMDTNELIIIDS